MRKNRILSLVVPIVLVLSVISIITINKAGGSNGIILYVGGSGAGNYTSIQSAIDDANVGDTVFVYNGTYFENVIIYKTISLIGENRNSTIIDGGGAEDVIYVSSFIFPVSSFCNQLSEITVKEFTIRGCGNTSTFGSNLDSGIDLGYSNNCEIESCIFYNNSVGICLHESSNNTISNCSFYDNSWGIFMTYYGSYETEFYDICNLDIFSLPNSHNKILNNHIHNNSGAGIHFEHMWPRHSSNIIQDNNISYNNIGISMITSEENEISYNVFYNNTGVGISLDMCVCGGENNYVHHNYFILNNDGGIQASQYSGGYATNFWYSSEDEQGNYWSDYNGLDINGDGIGDTNYTIADNESVDLYPLMHFPIEYGVELTCSDTEKFVLPEGTVSYEIMVKNTGNIVDSINLSLPPQCLCGWFESLNKYSLELLPNESIAVLLNVSTMWWQASMWPGPWSTTVNATSVGDSTKFDTFTVNTRIVFWATVSIDPLSQTIKEGESFTVNITVAPTDAIAGAQFDLYFDETLLSANSVAEGDLFSGYDTFFNPGIIDNINGKITGVYEVITTQGSSVYNPGTLASINFTTKGDVGVSPLNLSNVLVGDPDAIPVPSSVHSGSATIIPEDTEAPVSSVNTVTPYGHHLKETPLDITVDAFDEDSGVKEVSLYYRYGTDNTTWTDWMLYEENQTASPYTWHFTAPNGTGYYEFFSLAVDNAANLEAKPLDADSICRIYPNWDINMDQNINILDIIIIGQHFGDTGEPCWIPADVNCDGVINILDIIVVAQHWTTPLPKCRKGDCNCNGIILDPIDMTIFASAIGCCIGDFCYRECCDLNDDGCVDSQDLDIVIPFQSERYCEACECGPPWEPWP